MREITIKICVTMFRHPLDTNNDLKNNNKKLQEIYVLNFGLLT